MRGLYMRGLYMRGCARGALHVDIMSGGLILQAAQGALPTGVVTRSCPGSACMPKHNPSQTLALRITLAKTLSDAKLFWSSPTGSMPTFNGTYQNNAFSLSPAQVGLREGPLISLKLKPFPPWITPHLHKLEWAVPLKLLSVPRP